jgi:ferric-dicitrate binding protein FerR (iron transport regulator)
MKAKQLEKWILLEQSGELPPRLQKKLNACPEAQAKRDELAALFSAVQASDAEPSQWAAAKIHSRLQKERRSLLLPVRVWQPVLALAACLTLAVMTFDFAPEPSPVSIEAVAAAVEGDAWSTRFEEDLVELEGLILAISDTPLDIMEM